MAWFIVLTQSIAFLVMAPHFAFRAFATSSQSSASLTYSSYSPKSIELLLRQRQVAERSGQHSEVARIDRLILSYTLQALRDIEQNKHDIQTAAMLDYEATSLGTTSESPLSSSATQFSTRQKNNSLDRQELALVMQLGDTYNNLGTAYVHMKQFPSALGAYRKAAEWWPQSQGLNRNLGLIYAQTNQPEEAVHYLTAVVHTDSGDIDARIALALSLSELGRQQEVLDTLTPIKAQAKQRPAVAYVYARALMTTGNETGAREILDDIAKRPMEPRVAFLVSRALVLLSDDANALDALHSAEVSNDIPRLFYFEAMIQLRLKQPSKAIPLLEKELRMNPGDNEAEYALALTQLSEGDTASATEHFKHVLHERPDHPNANYEYGKILLNSGNVLEATRYLEAAEKLAPDKPFIHYQLQLAYRRAGRLDDAKRELRLYNAQKPTSDGHAAADTEDTSHQ